MVFLILRFVNDLLYDILLNLWLSNIFLEFIKISHRLDITFILVLQLTHLLKSFKTRFSLKFIWQLKIYCLIIVITQQLVIYDLIILGHVKSCLTIRFNLRIIIAVVLGVWSILSWQIYDFYFCFGHFYTWEI